MTKNQLRVGRDKGERLNINNTMDVFKSRLYPRAQTVDNFCSLSSGERGIIYIYIYVRYVVRRKKKEVSNDRYARESFVERMLSISVDQLPLLFWALQALSYITREPVSTVSSLAS